jgi:hypothetical protein
LVSASDGSPLFSDKRDGYYNQKQKPNNNVIASAAITLLSSTCICCRTRKPENYRRRQNIRLPQSKRIFLKIRRQYFSGIDRIRLTRHRNYKRITDLRLIRLQEEIAALTMTSSNFAVNV